MPKIIVHPDTPQQRVIGDIEFTLLCQLTIGETVPGHPAYRVTGKDMTNKLLHVEKIPQGERVVVATA